MLKTYFDWVVRKKLTTVEVNLASSNQHEINATSEVRTLLGQDKRSFQTQFMYFEGEQAVITEVGSVTYYDARKNHPTRTEYRLYFTTNAVTELMEVDDSLFFALRPNGEAMFIVASSLSSMSERLSWLFGMEEQPSLKFDAIRYSDDNKGELDFLSRQILDVLGIEYEDPRANEHDSIIQRFGLKFPKTKDFSDLARLTLKGIDARDDPDLALMAWLDHEEALFRRLEKKIVSHRLIEGFVVDKEADVDAFVSFSLSVQNRRKSRMGHSLENHIAAVFDANDVEFASQFRTKKGKRPDFIFPSARAYLDKAFPSDLLTMLAAKSSCKERWSQVLSEAERIPNKHLLTLEPGIPNSTTDLMIKENLQLVVPRDRQVGYSVTQQKWLMSVADFISLVKERQKS